MTEKIRSSLSFKVVLMVIISISIIAGTSFFAIHLKQRNWFLEIEKEKATLLAKSLESSLVSAMVTGKPEEVQDALETIVKENPHVKDIAIYSHQWMRTFSAIPSKRRALIKRDKEEQCLVCHRLTPDKRPATVFVNIDGEEVLRGVAPVRKRKECARCHPQKEKSRGMLIVDLDTKPLQEKLSTNTVWVFSGGGITFIALVSAIFLAINRMVTKPLAGITGSLKRIGSGDLKRGIDDPMILNRIDSIGILTTSINSMAESLKKIVSNIHSLASNVKSSTEMVVSNIKRLKDAAKENRLSAENTSSSMEEMDRSTEEVLKSINELSTLSEEVSASVLEMTSTIEEVSQHAEGLNNSVEEATTSITQMLNSIKDVAANTQGLSTSASQTASSMNEIEASINEIKLNAGNAEKLSIKASKDAEIGYGIVEETIKGITETREIINSLGTRMEGLNERSKEIGNILTIIDQIADQTSLLALNASIIAAQAGEHGKSFGVVASEIKKLSEQTTASTKDIAELIEAVQFEVGEATDSMQQGSASIKKSTELALKAGSSLNAILESSKKTAESLQEIVKATEEQVRATGYVAQATENVKVMVERTAQAIQELSEGTEYISNQIELMKTMTRQVKDATLEQSKGSKLISQAMAGVNDRVKGINMACEEHKRESQNVVVSMEGIVESSERYLESLKEIESAISNLSGQIVVLKDEVERFKV